MSADQQVSWVEEQEALFVLNCSYFSATTFLAYDICLTLADEVEFVWTQSWRTPSKWVYIVLRYYSLFVLISLWFAATDLGVAIGFSRPFDCVGWYKYQVASLQIITCLMEIILIFRVYALYEQSKRIAAFILSAFAVDQSIMAWSISVVIPRVKFTEDCTTTSVPNTSVWIGLSPILFELMLLVMTVHKAMKTGGRIAAHSRLLRILVRDGMWCFWVVFITFGINGIFYLAISGPKNAVVWGWQYAVSAFAGCRLVLHLHAGASSRGSTLVSSSMADGDGALYQQYVLDSLTPDILAEPPPTGPESPEVNSNVALRQSRIQFEEAPAGSCTRSFNVQPGRNR